MAKKVENTKFRETGLRVPLAPVDQDRSVIRHLDIQLTRAEAETLRSILNGFQARGDRLGHGSKIPNSAPDAVRMMIQLVAESLTGLVGK